MPRATSPDTTPRRALLRGFIAGTFASAAALAARHADAAGGPDAELIAICAQHIENIRAFDADPEDAGDDNRLLLAYRKTHDAISVARAQTFAGFVAKARAAKVEARCHDGSEMPEFTSAAPWAWDLVNDMLRIGGAE